MGRPDMKKGGFRSHEYVPLHAGSNSAKEPRMRISRNKFLLFHCFVTFLFVVHVVFGVGKGPVLSKFSEPMKKYFGAYPVSDPLLSGPTHPCVSTIRPISENEFGSRQLSLAQTLVSLNGEAYIAEPGAQTQFIGNFSHVNWKLSERPLFLIITPRGIGNSTEAEVSVLTPKFEGTRAKLLSIPFATRYIEWAEEENPYAVAVEALGFNLSREGSLEGKKLFIDNSARHFHYDGFSEVLKGTGVAVTSAPPEINRLREQKSATEIEIMKCVHEATLVAIRHVHKQMHIGMRESEARNMMSMALSQIGLSQGGCLTLFGENAALPHGSGTDKALGSPDFALFDCTAALHGYWSDVTRTVALPSSQISSRHLDIWNTVLSAQTFARLRAHAGARARDVDEAARLRFRLGGERLDQYFTHRLGHGIGLEVHEAPYLNGGNDVILQQGHAFSNEPGIYIEGEVGVRLEDCMYIGEWGLPVYLTAGVGGTSKSPWDP